MPSLREMLELQKQEREKASGGFAEKLQAKAEPTKSFGDMKPDPVPDGAPAEKPSKPSLANLLAKAKEKPATKPAEEIRKAPAGVKITTEQLAHAPSVAEVASTDLGDFKSETTSDDFNHSSMTEELSEEDAAAFREHINFLADNMDDKNMVKDVMQTIIHNLRKNPKLETIFKPEDMQIMVRALRAHYAHQVVAKKSRQTKKKKVDAAADDFVAAFQGIKF